MEFEHGTAPTAEDIALADTPRMSVQPFHSDLMADSQTIDHSGRTTGSFAFEQETTAEAAKALQNTQHPHKRMAIISAIACIGVFTGLLLVVLSLR